jgi:tetratricopeptide (TPR) repeat protein
VASLSIATGCWSRERLPVRGKKPSIAAIILMALFMSLMVVRAQDASAPVFPAARAELLPVPLPSLAALEAAVVHQIDEALQSVRLVAANRDADRGALAEAYGRLGEILHAYEFFEAAAASYDNARRGAPRDYRWPHLLAYLREQTGGFEEAIDLYLAALRLEPADHASEVRLASVFLQLDRRGEARSRFDAQRSRFPASSSAGLGEIALRERRFEDAIRLFEDALRRAPHANSLHYSIGMAFRGLGRLDEARQHLARTGQGRLRPADPLVDGLPALLRGVQSLLNQARVEFQAGAYEAAAAAFRRAIAIAPRNTEAHTGLAASLEHLGNREAALVEIVRGDERPVLELALRLADEQRFGDAIGLLTTAYERFPERDGTATTLARLLAASPDRSLRNGTRALGIAMAVYDRHATAAHAETVALALAELNRCAEAGKWLGDALAHARADVDRDELARLEGEARRYERAPCR